MSTSENSELNSSTTEQTEITSHTVENIQDDKTTIPPTSTIIETDTNEEVGNKVEFEDGTTGDIPITEPVIVEDVEVLKYENKHHLKDDGYLGIPTFTNEELSIIEHNLLLDTSMIKTNTIIMETVSAEIALSTKKYENITEEEKGKNEDYKLYKDQLNAYVSARNVIVNYKNAIESYLKFISDNKEEILSVFDERSKILVERYIEQTKEFEIPYEENTLMFYIMAIALKRAVKNIDDDHIFKLLTTYCLTDKYDIEFEKEIKNTLKSVNLISSNVSNAYTNKNDAYMSRFESDVIRMISSIATRFTKFKPDVSDELEEKCKNLIGTPRVVFTTFLYKMASLVKKGFYSSFVKEKIKYTNEMKRRIKKSAQTSFVIPMFPYHDNFIKTRLSLNIVEVYLKKIFSMTLFGEGKHLDDKKNLISLIGGELDKSYKSSQMLLAIVNTFSYKMIFDEIMNIYKTISNVDDKDFTNNVKRCNLLKSYLTFGAYNKYSTKYKDYDFKKLYSDYFDALVNKIDSYTKS